MTTEADLLLREEIRAGGRRLSPNQMDTVARYGGEEFAILLPATDLAGAARTGERIREYVAGQPFAHGPLTVSLGVACHDCHAPGDLIAAADAALYRAKSLGRNQVCVAREGVNLASLEDSDDRAG